MAKATSTATETVEAVEVETVEEIDLTSFESAVNAAVEGADSTTGEVPEIEVAKVRDAYQALAGIKAKNAAKASLSDKLKAYLVAMDAPKARSVMVLTERATVAGKSQAPKKEVNLQDQYVSKVATLTLALYLAQNAVPEGVEQDSAVATATEQANEAFAEALEVVASDEATTESNLIKAAIKLASTKARKSGARVSSGERRDLGAHIAEAFDAAESGQFLSVAEIKKFKGSIYGDEQPSAGAITNRLEPKSGKATTIPGVTVEHRDGKLGAVKQ